MSRPPDDRPIGPELLGGLEGIGLVPPTVRLDGEPTVAELVGRRQRLGDAGFGTLALVETASGVLRWQEGFAGALPSRRGRAGHSRRVHHQVKFRHLAPNEIGRYLARLDQLFVDPERHGLRRFSARSHRLGRAGVRPAPAGRVLVLDRSSGKIRVFEEE